MAVPWRTLRPRNALQDDVDQVTTEDEGAEVIPVALRCGSDPCSIEMQK